MSVRAKKSGLSADIQKKLEAKYNLDQEKQCRAWIEEVLGEPLSDQEVGMHNFASCLKDGQVLCRLLNTLNGETLIKKINPQKMAFKQMENIEQFIKGCKVFGLKDGDIFQTADLYEVQNMSQVIGTLYSVSSYATSLRGYAGPSIGTKIAEKNEREFDEETLKAGMSIVGGQMGFTEGETQSGMTMGKTRKVCD